MPDTKHQKYLRRSLTIGEVQLQKKHHEQMPRYFCPAFQIIRHVSTKRRKLDKSKTDPGTLTF